ncbi:hypothetical protein [Burkholderia diffusa]|uniref:hypothetical protein n=1 Tax=Burkholderia diffusa TaxID=488732 RepID=UPI00158A1EF2|nr:hypothetical protein [Burkholderia diffusa]
MNHRQRLDTPAREQREMTEYVARKVTRGAVVVAARHPVVGLIYWWFLDESEVNYPDHFGLTTNIELAHRFSPRNVPYERFRSAILECNTEEGWEGHEDEYGPFEVTIAAGDFRSLAKAPDIDPDALLEWFEHIPWVACPAPPTVHYIADFNGYLGYRAVWTDNLAQATRFSHSEIHDDEDLDVSLARTLAELVTVDEAALTRSIPDAPKPARINHALEADVAWTHCRLRLGGYDTLKRWERRALDHAACAGHEYAIAGHDGAISGHIARFPELLAAFETCAAVHRACDLARESSRANPQ